MTSTIAEPEILKTDGLGRVRTPAAQREALLDAFERSGLSGMKFAALHGVKYPSFANWVQQRKRRQLMTHAGGEGHPRPPSDLTGAINQCFSPDGSWPRDAPQDACGGTAGSIQFGTTPGLDGSENDSNLPGEAAFESLDWGFPVSSGSAFACG